MNKQQLLAKCADLGIDTEGLNTNAKLKAAIDAREAEMAKQAEAKAKAQAEVEAAAKAEAEAKAQAEAEEAAKAEEEARVKAEAEKAEAEAKAKTEAAEKAKAAATKKKSVPSYTDDRGRKWAFKSTAPKRINIDGHPMSQKEILESEDVISELVYGNSSFLTQTF